MKLSYLVAFVAMFVSTQAQAFDLEAFTNRVYPHCWPPQTAEAEVETCIGQAMVDICDPLRGSERAECEAAGATALAKYTVQAATARAEKAEAALVASRRAQSAMSLPVVTPPPVTVPVPQASTPAVTTPPPTRSVVVVSSNGVVDTGRRQIGPTQGSSLVYTEPPTTTGCYGTEQDLGRFGGGYVFYLRGEETPAKVVRKDASGEWAPRSAFEVDLNRNNVIDENEHNVPVVAAEDFTQVFFSGGPRDGVVSVRYVHVMWDEEAQAWFRDGTTANQRFDFAGCHPWRNTEEFSTTTR